MKHFCHFRVKAPLAMLSFIISMYLQTATVRGYFLEADVALVSLLQLQILLP